MTRVLVPNDKPLPEPTSDGLGGLPTACWDIDDCLAHRCSKHTAVAPLNEGCEYDSFAECGACLADTSILSFQRTRRRIRRSATGTEATDG